MNFTCPFSGTQYSVSVPAEDSNIRYISLHPVCNMHLQQILTLPSSFLKTIGMLHFLSTRGLITYVPYKAFTKGTCDDAVLHNLNTLLHKTIIRITSANAKTKNLPRLRLHKSTLQEIFNYTQLLDDAMRQEDAAAEFLNDVTPGQRRTYITQKMQATRAMTSTIKWANEQLIMRCPSFNMATSLKLQSCIDGKETIAIIKRVRELLLDYLPDTRVEDSIRKDALIFSLDSRIGEIVASFGQGSMLSAEEREAVQSTLSRYTALEEIPVEMQALQAMTQVTQLQEPVRENYATSLQYTIAHMAWKASQVAAGE